MSPILHAIAAVLVPFVAAIIVTEFSKLSALVQALGAPLTAVASVLLAFLFGWLSTLLGITLPGDLSGFDLATVTAALNALVQLLFPVQAALKARRRALGLKH